EYANGKLTLNLDDVLKANNPAKLINTIYHEFAHFEQENVVIRLLASERNLPHPATPDQIAELKHGYESETGRAISDKRLQDVLHAEGDKISQKVDSMKKVYAEKTGLHLSDEQAKELVQLGGRDQARKLQELSGGKLSKADAENVLRESKSERLTDA